MYRCKQWDRQFHARRVEQTVPRKPSLLGLLLALTVSPILSQRYAPNHLALVSDLNAGINIGVGGLGAVLAGLAAGRWGLPPVLAASTVLPILSSLLSLTLPSTIDSGHSMVQYEEPTGGR